MNWSLNEIESLSRKATRGSGLSWGLAEEAGKASRWLVSLGLPGPEMLAALLTESDGIAYDALCPSGATQAWAANDGPLSPLIAGAALCDHASLIAAGQNITLGATSYPLLLVPYVAAAAVLSKTPMEIIWGATCGRVNALGQLGLIEGSDTQATQTETISIRLTDDDTGVVLVPSPRGNIDDQTAKILNAFAHRTYAPDTAESRLGGAGAGLTDND